MLRKRGAIAINMFQSIQFHLLDPVWEPGCNLKKKKFPLWPTPLNYSLSSDKLIDIHRKINTIESLIGKLFINKIDG